MTDRELLELAAKAAGHKIAYWGKPDIYSERSGEVAFVVAVGEWNPLTNDGDALRLAVKLGLRDYFAIEIQDTVTQATSMGSWEITMYEDYKNYGPYDATRRAIVRAAAEIGKGMK